MNTFKDATGTSWTLEITLGVARSLRVHRLDVLNPEIHSRLASSVGYRIALVLLLCEVQMKARGIAASVLEDRIAGSAVVKASEALTREVNRFLPVEREVRDEDSPSHEEAKPLSWSEYFTKPKSVERSAVDVANERWQWVAEMAAIAGIDPWPWTLRELIAATEKKQLVEWDRFSDLMAHMANIHCDGTYYRHSFHPMRQPPKAS